MGDITRKENFSGQTGPVHKYKTRYN